ncbi:MAG: glutamine-hydrolyzing GMP synthase [SAR202 cluster bacterium]|nr:glutamine-hydrolyzing GMP synthase [SAR202 cluster bacterium]MQG36428.1 glutamine-hydrolyzing GMP synthase [SAR202 cluster bacterium]MQG86355.1 glutamine-hydrolyzing GMP synthase [SAR202 cluster bacterium]
MEEKLVILDYGSQYTHLIARRVREQNVYSEVHPPEIAMEDIVDFDSVKGIILSGGPMSVYDEEAPTVPSWVFECGLPILGICYGMQAIVHQLGGKVEPGEAREYGLASLIIEDAAETIFSQIPSQSSVWMSHGDKVVELPPQFKSLAQTDNTEYCVISSGNQMYGIQFHPEVHHTSYGETFITNFLVQVCKFSQNWDSGRFIESSMVSLKEQLGASKVVCALSGGVDSAVTAALLHHAVGDQLKCIFVNNGLLRLDEENEVREIFKDVLNVDINYLDASKRFIDKLQGIVDPEIKRKTIGYEFIKCFEEETDKLGGVEFLAQGTLYPDVIESVSTVGKAAVIKTHHNVGGLPENMQLKLVEPLRYLFKDEVRKVGLELGLPPNIIHRQPFPGPGLAIRIIGEITQEKLDILKLCDRIVTDELAKSDCYEEIWQGFAVLTDSHTVGVMGDFRTYGYVCALRIVSSEDAMTANWVKVPYEVLETISSRIVNEVSGVNRVVYDITNKPPGTIEWE